jgi:hypothetical protein
MKEAFIRLHSSSVTVLPTSCEAGDFVFDLTETKYYMCISPGKWVYPNYIRNTKKNTGNLDKAGVGINLVVIRFPDATNPTVPLHPRQDHPPRRTR